MMTQRRHIWHYSLDSLMVFAILGVVFIPFPFHLFHLSLADHVFGGLIHFLSGYCSSDFKLSISSDSASMYVLIGILFIFSLVLSFCLRYIKWWHINREKMMFLLRRILLYYLALQLLTYGFDKIFKGQFYSPEPNIFYTPLGQLDKDMLFWSAVGTSYLYTFFTGLIECLVGCMLFFRRTRDFALCLAVMVLSHVLLINLGFDISVKLFSAFLLFIALLLLSPQLNRLYSFFVLHNLDTLKREVETFSVMYHGFVRVSLKTFIIGMLFLEALYPALKSGQLNDDSVPRPFLHGAYEIVGMKEDELAVNICQSPVRRFFIHREGYLIFQDWQDKMTDYQLTINPEKNQMLLTDYHSEQIKVTYKWLAKDAILELSYFDGHHLHHYKAKALHWKELPVLKKQFHWTMDSYGEGHE